MTYDPRPDVTAPVRPSQERSKQPHPLPLPGARASGSSNAGQHDLKRKTVRSIIWTVIRIGSTNGFSFIVFSVLARLLSPTEFGTFTLALLVVELTRVIATAGLGDAVTRVHELDEDLASTAFWANLLFGCLVGAGVWILAGPYATFVGQPEVAPILRCLSILVPVSSLAGIHTARTVRAFQHRLVTTRAIVSGLLGGVCAVVAAWQGCGIWSLVLQALVADVVGLVLTWRAFPWVPALRLSWPRLRSVLAFSASMMLTQLLSLMTTRTQDLIVGHNLDAAAVGAYRVAWRMVEIISQVTVLPIATVSMVTLAKLQTDRVAFSNAFLRMLALAAAVTLPAMMGFGLVAGNAIVLLFGPKWAQSVDVAYVLAVLALPYTLSYLVPQALASAGRSAVTAQVATVQLALTAAFSLVGIRYGVVGVAAAYVLRVYVTMPYLLWCLQRETGVRAVAVLRTIVPPLLASLVMVAVMLLAHSSLAEMMSSRVERLAANVALGACAYCIGLVIFGWQFVAANLRIVLPLLPFAGPLLAKRSTTIGA